MGYPDSFSTKSDPRTVSVGVDSRRYVNRTAGLGHELSDIGGGTCASDRSAAVQYCISNDLI